MATAGFSCKHCSMWFKTKIGLGVHKQSQHRAEYEEEIQVPKSKTRWSQEELAVMATHEAILIFQGKIAEINSELLPLFPNRTRETIKGQKRQQKYKDLVCRIQLMQSCVLFCCCSCFYYCSCCRFPPSSIFFCVLCSSSCFFSCS
ncbi:hypothetical protein AVEN_97580-1 [Araneus ventricosus]|uniref:C2H2-type domain-containing protein n=1 Tax=Araneus ventricosus TaxID=182803 RepID=A0A4Y2F7L8_ARAVE|nr:hypothetical protein AVEN_97580-1 [Araneus ventricosus]